MTQDRRITDKLPGHPLQWDDSASPSAAPAAGQAGLANHEWTLIRHHDMGAVRDARGELISMTYFADAKTLTDAHNASIRFLAAPVAADTEQATDERAAFDAWLAKGNACGANHSLWKGWQARAALAAPLATPADAGAGAEQARPSFYVIVDAQGRAEYVTMLPHEAQEHINDACSEGVEGSGRWKAIPVYAAAVEQAKDAERYRILRGAKKIPASVWHALETGENIDQEVDFLIALNKTIPMCAPCQEGRYNECQHAIPCVLPAASTPVARPNADCSGDPSNCPDNEGYGCECGSGQSPAPVTAEPLSKGARALLGRLAQNNYACYLIDTNPDIVREFLATPAPADRDAIRDQALNINEQFAVTLTETGAATRNSHYEWMREKHLDAAPKLSVAGDVLVEPLWVLMKIFGSAIHMGMPESPFKDNAIRALKTQPAASPTANDEQEGEESGWLARRFCKGDNEWTEWQAISAAEYEKRRADSAFEFKRAADAAETRDAKGGA